MPSMNICFYRHKLCLTIFLRIGHGKIAQYNQASIGFDIYQIIMYFGLSNNFNYKTHCRVKNIQEKSSK